MSALCQERTCSRRRSRMRRPSRARCPCVIVTSNDNLLHGGELADDEIEKRPHARRFFHVLMYEQIDIRRQIRNRSEKPHKIAIVVPEAYWQYSHANS